MERRNAQK